MASRIRRDKLEATIDRIREEIPVAPVVADAMEEQGRWAGAGPRPIDELGPAASDRAAFGHQRARDAPGGRARRAREPVQKYMPARL